MTESNMAGEEARPAETARLINPEMVYRPPAAQGSYSQPQYQARRRIDDDDGGDDDGEEKPVKFRFHFILVFRVLALLIAFVAFVLWCVAGIGRNGVDVFVVITLWLLIIYQLLIVFPRSFFKRNYNNIDPIQCSVGVFTCTIGSPNDGDDDHDPDGGDGRKKKPSRGLWFLDFIFGLVLMILLIIGSASSTRWSSYYGYRRIAPAVMSWCLMGVEFFIAFTSHFRVFRQIVVIIYTDNSDEDVDRRQSRIRLPQDVQPRWVREAGGKNVSIVA